MTTVATAGPLTVTPPSAPPVSSTQEAPTSSSSQDSFTQILSDQSIPTSVDSMTTGSSGQTSGNLASTSLTHASETASSSGVPPTLMAPATAGSGANGGTSGPMTSNGAPPAPDSNAVATAPVAPLNTTGVANDTPVVSPLAGASTQASSDPPRLAPLVAPPVTPSGSTDTIVASTASARPSTLAPGVGAKAPRATTRSKELPSSNAKKATTTLTRSNGPLDAGAQGVPALSPLTVDHTGPVSAPTKGASDAMTPAHVLASASNSVVEPHSVGAQRGEHVAAVTVPVVTASDRALTHAPVEPGPTTPSPRTDTATLAQGPLVAPTQVPANGPHAARDTATATNALAGLTATTVVGSSKAGAVTTVAPTPNAAQGPSTTAGASTSDVTATTVSALLDGAALTHDPSVSTYAATPSPVAPMTTVASVSDAAALSFGLGASTATPGSVSLSASNRPGVTSLRDGASSPRGSAPATSPRTSVSSLESLAGAVGGVAHVNAATPGAQMTASLAGSTSVAGHGLAAALGEGRLSGLDVGSLSGAISRPLSEGNGTYSVSLALHPVELGHVQAVMTLTGNELQVSLTAHTDHGHAALTGAMNDLKNELSRGGVNVNIDLRNPQSQTPDDARRPRTSESPSPVTVSATNFATVPTPSRDSGQIHLVL
ncbi:MAG: flagellar hook-length control protein FliK [Acidimicrobiales bacterium]